MALVLSTSFPTQTTTDPAYPQGKAQNVTVSGDGTGTPLDELIYNDQFGFQQSLLDMESITPSGVPDEVGSSQYLDALRRNALMLWNTVVTYPVKALVRGSDGFIYKCVLENAGNTPVGDGGTNWILYSKAGKDFATLAEFVADTDLVIGDLCTVHERTTDATGDGWNNYIVVAAATGTVDGGSYINLTGSTLQAKGLFSGGDITGEQFGAVADGIDITDGAITTGTTTFTSPSNPFTADMVGWGIAVYNGGASTDSLIAVIDSYNSAGSVELSIAAGTTVSGAYTQLGTDNSTAIQAAIDYLDVTNRGTLSLKGAYYCGTDIGLRADNATYLFKGARIFKANTVIGDLRDTTRILNNIEGYGGSFEPIGDTITAGSVNYNALVAVAAHNVKWFGPKAVTRGGTRQIGAQTDAGWGITPFQNLNNIQFLGISGVGDGTTVDGVDITSGGGTEMVKNIIMTGYIEGVGNGVNCASGTSGQTQSGIFLDLIIRDAFTVGAKVDRVLNSSFNFNIIGATLDGFTSTDPQNSNFKLQIGGVGASLGTAANFAGSVDTTNKVNMIVTHDGTNKWTKGLLPGCQDVHYESIYLDGCDDGIDPSGFRSVYGSVVVRNCTVPVVDLNFDADMFTVPVIDLGTGANGRPILDSMNRFKTEDINDTDVTYTVGDGPNIRAVTTLTADRTITLSNTGAYDGATVEISRPALGSFDLDIDGFDDTALISGDWCKYKYNTASGGWILWFKGTLL